jgi:hypothetical protein
MRKPIAYIKYREISFMRAVRNEGVIGWHTNLGLVPEEGDVPLYEGKEWVGLTDEDRKDFYQGKYVMSDDDLMDAVEAKLKEKNT